MFLIGEIGSPRLKGKTMSYASYLYDLWSYLTETRLVDELDQLVYDQYMKAERYA